MVTRLEPGQVTQRCENCGNVVVLPLAMLAIGAGGDPNIIALPPCVLCGSREFLNRTVDNPGSHAAAVNRLHELLIGRGAFPPVLAGQIAALPAKQFPAAQEPFDVPTADKDPRLIGA